MTVLLDWVKACKLLADVCGLPLKRKPSILRSLALCLRTGMVMLCSNDNMRISRPQYHFTRNHQWQRWRIIVKLWRLSAVLFWVNTFGLFSGFLLFKVHPPLFLYRRSPFCRFHSGLVQNQKVSSFAFLLFFLWAQTLRGTIFRDGMISFLNDVSAIDAK